MPRPTAAAPKHDRRQPRDAHLLRLARVSAADDVREDVVRERAGAGEREPGNDRQDRGECDGRDEPEERRSAEQFRDERRRHVAAGIDPADDLASDQRGCAKADDRG